MQYLIDNFFSLTMTGITLGSVYALVALGYTMVYGVLRLINFAHSEVFLYGTFATLWVTYFMGATPNSSTGAVIGMLAVALVLSMAVSGGVALLLEKFAYRPLIKRNAPQLIALISAIGASFFLSEAMGLRDRITGFIGLDDNLSRYVASARDTRSIAFDMPRRNLFAIGDYQVNTTDLLVILSALLMMLAVDQFIRRSRLGRGVRAVAQDPES